MEVRWRKKKKERERFQKKVRKARETGTGRFSGSKKENV